MRICFQVFVSIYLCCWFPEILLGQTQRVEITRDTWLSNYADEAKGSNGGASRLKLKSIQELSIIDFDPEPFRERTIKSAKLWLRSSGEPYVDRITVSTITADWIEGDSQSYAIKDGHSTFSHRVYPNERWADSDVTAVSLGNGGSMWASVQATKPDADGWIHFDVPPHLIAARVAGISYGLLLMDDTGSEWKRDGEKFEHILFPNRFVFSRDSNRQSSPYLTIELAGKDDQPPAPPRNVLDQPSSSPTDPRRQLTWTTDADAVGYKVVIDGQPLPQYFIPAAKPDQAMRLTCDPMLPAWDENLRHAIEILAVDSAGNSSKPTKIDIPATIPAELSKFSLHTESATNQPKPGHPHWPVAQLSDCAFVVMDPLDKFLPISQKFVPTVRDDYLRKNAIWDSHSNTIQLDAAHAQWVGFQLLSKKPPKDLEFEWRMPSLKNSRLEVHRYEYIPHEGELLPDPLSALESGNNALVGKLPLTPNSLHYCGWLFECWTDPKIEQGHHEGQLVLKSGGKKISLKVSLNVHHSTIPNVLSFLPEMNCYDLPANDRDYYRLANRHRAVLNRVPYYQNGRVAEGFTPTISNGHYDWTAWDKRFSEYFDGSAFADLPRGQVPIECFYLPLHENWPSPMEGNYSGNYWADQAFTANYRQAFVDASRAFCQHISDRGWNETKFHVYLNNKVDFKQRGWSRGSSVWLLDEPANFQDFVALQFFAKAFRQGKQESNGKNQVMFRADISRPQWQRDTLDGLLDYNFISQSAFRMYPRLVLDRKLRENQTLMIYGGTNVLTASNVQSVAWCWDVWCRGGDGVLPWQTIGTEESWRKPDELALFYPPPTDTAPGTNAIISRAPLPSIRLKAYCYGQQDAELLAMLASHEGDRYALGRQLLKQIGLRPVIRTTDEYTEDAGWADYGQLSPEIFTLFRRELYRQLDSAEQVPR